MNRNYWIKKEYDHLLSILPVQWTITYLLDKSVLYHLYHKGYNVRKTITVPDSMRTKEEFDKMALTELKDSLYKWNKAVNGKLSEWSTFAMIPKDLTVDYVWYFKEAEWLQQVYKFKGKVIATQEQGKFKNSGMQTVRDILPMMFCEFVIQGEKKSVVVKPSSIIFAHLP